MTWSGTFKAEDWTADLTIQSVDTLRILHNASEKLQKCLNCTAILDRKTRVYKQTVGTEIQPKLSKSSGHDLISVHEIGFHIVICLHLRLRPGHNRLSNTSLFRKWAKPDNYRFRNRMPIRLLVSSSLLQHVSSCARL